MLHLTPLFKSKLIQGFYNQFSNKIYQLLRININTAVKINRVYQMTHNFGFQNRKDQDYICDLPLSIKNDYNNNHYQKQEHPNLTQCSSIQMKFTRILTEDQNSESLESVIRTVDMRMRKEEMPLQMEKYKEYQKEMKKEDRPLIHPLFRELRKNEKEGKENVVMNQMDVKESKNNSKVVVQIYSERIAFSSQKYAEKVKNLIEVKMLNSQKQRLVLNSQTLKQKSKKRKQLQEEKEDQSSTRYQRLLDKVYNSNKKLVRCETTRSLKKMKSNKELLKFQADTMKKPQERQQLESYKMSLKRHFSQKQIQRNHSTKTINTLNLQKKNVLKLNPNRQGLSNSKTQKKCYVKRQVLTERKPKKIMPSVIYERPVGYLQIYHDKIKRRF